MPSPKGDPTFIADKDRFFMAVAHTVGEASTHPKMQGGCVIVRDREIIGDGRSLLTHSKVEVDPVSYAIASAGKNGTQTLGATIYSTRYPFSASVFQAHVMGIRRIVVLAHEWEPYFADEFRRAAKIARELKVAIDPLFPDQDKRFTRGLLDRKEYEPHKYNDEPFEPFPDPADQYATFNADECPVRPRGKRSSKKQQQDPLPGGEGSGE